MRNTILVTGGTGYIGSHTCLELVAAGYAVVIVDNLVNSRRSVVARLEKISGQRMPFYEGDVRDRVLLQRLFASYPIQAVIHFAGLKAVGESNAKPLSYYENNIAGTVTLLQVMDEYAVHRIVFSSSATIYGDASTQPIAEESVANPTNPYGRTKLAIEWLLSDMVRSSSNWRAILLRYFNPAGAHASGFIGEDPNGIPNNLMPYVAQVASGRLHELAVFGNDYPTADGTGVRDYIHVTDLALGHVAALNTIERIEPLSIFNLGSGQGYSVLDVVRAFEKVAGIRIPFRIAPRRTGDVAMCYANPRRAREILRWQAERDLMRMCEDAWRWQQWHAAHCAEL